MKKPDTPPAKKPYRAPVLETYGDLRKLTRNLGSTGMNDPGSSSTSKTGLP